MSVDAMTQAALMITMARGAAAKQTREGSIGEVLDQLDKRTADMVLNKLERGEVVSGAEALLAWQQLLTNRRLRRELERREQSGIIAAVALKPAMDGEE